MGGRMDLKPIIDQYPTPTREQYFDFLVRCFFNEGSDLMLLCARRAYLDFNRTLRGFAKHPGNEELRDDGHRKVLALLVALPGKKIASQATFDNWHQAACVELRNLYHTRDFARFSIGHAQKWLNMSLKYAFTLGEDRLPGYAPLYQFAHIPIDDIFLKQAETCGVPRLPCMSAPGW